MTKKKNVDSDDSPEGFHEEFKSVRFYSNLNGGENEYGYDYKRSADGKEEFTEIGDIPADFGNDFIERVNNFDRQFSDFGNIFAKSINSVTDLFPIFAKFMGNADLPRLLIGKEPILKPRIEDSSVSDIPYDIQLDDNKKELYVLVELPGFSKEDVKIKLTKKGLHLIGANSSKQIETTIPLDNEIDRSKKISASLRNGVLEVKMKLLNSQHKEGFDIPIN